MTSNLEEVRCGDRLGLAGTSDKLPLPMERTLLPEVFPGRVFPFPADEELESRLEALTGKYPNLECFSKYFLDLNLFLSSFVKSRMSSPEVV